MTGLLYHGILPQREDLLGLKAERERVRAAVTKLSTELRTNAVLHRDTSYTELRAVVLAQMRFLIAELLELNERVHAFEQGDL